MKFSSLLLSVSVLSAQLSFAGFFDNFSARVRGLSSVIPQVSAAAEAAAGVIADNPQAQIYIPLRECFGFHEEMISRAGGLTQFRNWRLSPYDVVLFAVRSWEEIGDDAVHMVRNWQEEGHKVILIASKAGMPEGLNPDFQIDNLASDGTRRHSEVNALVNVVLGWMWCCEYGSAFSRKGLFPAVTKGILTPDSWGHNAGTSAPDRNVRFYKCDTTIPPGELALVYLYRVRKLLAEILEPHVAKPMAEAARIIADRLESGKRVAVAGLGHMILEEPKHGLVSPMIGFRAVSMLPDSFFNAVEEGDIIVWLTYMGMDSAWDNYSAAIKKSGADLIASFAESVPPSSKDGMLAFIPQSWTIPDAEVSIPVPPYSMAPVSAVNRVLLLRMLDESVADELSARPVPIPRRRMARFDRYCNYGEEGSRMGFDGREIQGREPVFGLLDSTGGVVVASSFTRPLYLRGKDQAVEYDNGVVTIVNLPTGERTVFTNTVNRTGMSKQIPAGFMRWSSLSGTDLCIAGSNNLWGVCTKAGEKIIPAVYDNLIWLSPDKFIAQKGEKYGLISLDGTEIVPVVYDMIKDCGSYLSICSNVLFGVMDRNTGAVLTPPRYDIYIERLGDNVKGRINGKSGIFTMTGETLLAPEYDNIVAQCGDNLAVAVRGGESFIVGFNGAEPPFTNRFDSIARLGDDRYHVSKGRKFGILDSRGRILLPVEYEQVSLSTVSAYGENIVKKDGTLYIVSSDYSVSPFPFECDYAEPVRGIPRENLNGGRQETPHWFRVARDGKWGIVDAGGKVVVPMRYSFVGDILHSGRVLFAEGGEWDLGSKIRPSLSKAKWGAMDMDGKIVIEALYDILEEAGYGYWNFGVKKKFRPMIP